jgi:PAS domain S-box-containing protein
MQQVWHPMRSWRWNLAWRAKLGAMLVILPRRVAEVWLVPPVWEGLVTMVCTGCFLFGVWQMARIFTEALRPPPRAPYGHFTLTRESVILSWDRIAQRIFGYTASEVVGQTLYDTIVPAHSHAIYWQEVARYLAAYEDGHLSTAWHPFVVRHKDGTLFTVELLLTPVPVPDGAATFTCDVRQVYSV